MRALRVLPFLGLLLVLAMASGLACPSRAQEAVRPGMRGLAEVMEKMDVLVLHSYHQGYKWTDDVNAGILSVLEGEAAEAQVGAKIEVQIEYMDTKRIYDEKYVQHLYETLVSLNN